MTTSKPLITGTDGKPAEIASTSKLGPVTGGTSTGEVMTQDQFGTNSTKMLPGGSPAFTNLTATSSVDTPLISHAGHIDITPSSGSNLDINVAASGGGLRILSSSAESIVLDRSSNTDTGTGLSWYTASAAKWSFGPANGSENLRLFNATAGVNSIAVDGTTGVPTLFTPILGNVTSGNLANCTGYTAANLTGAGTGVLTLLATPSSANLAAALTDETGSAGSAVFSSAPTLTNAVINQAANGDTAIKSVRNTDTAPTGNFLDFQSAASSSIFKVDRFGALTVNVTAQASTAERLFTFGVTDSATTFTLDNGTTNANFFNPTFNGVIEQTVDGVAISFFGTKGVDTTTNTAILFLYRHNTGSGNADLSATVTGVEFRNRATKGAGFTGGHNFQFFGGATSPTVASIISDVVSLCGFDRVNTRHSAAGNRSLAVQGERGSPIYIGDDAIDFGAATGLITINGTDITLTATTVALPQKISAYNAIATAGNGVPAEYAVVDLTGQTANIGATTLYAVPAGGGGMYRVTALVVLTTAASVSSTLPNVQIVYTDVHTGGAVTIDATPVLGVAGTGQTGALTANTVGTTSGGVIPINAKLSTNIQYQTVNYASSLAGMAYALHIVLEKN